MSKLNCWQFKNCGREPGGVKSESLGVCPASTQSSVDGINSGVNGGRACWAISGTLCGGVVQGTFAAKLGNCLKCEFYKQVYEEEGPRYKLAKEILGRL